jgi:Ser/Thr protein kinase RdoA (MazF antagonist)
MIEYNKLTYRGKLGRLKKLAVKALDEYGLTGSRVIFHCFNTNLFYRILTPTGEKYIMRLAMPGWRTRENLESEVLWLDSLAGKKEISVPSVIPAKSGEKILSLSQTLIPDIWNITLFSYLPGRLLGHYLSRKNLYKMGRLFARLHIHGKEWNIPKGFSSAQFDRYLSRGEEERLFSQDILASLPRETVELLYSVRERVYQEYSQLNESDLRVIHCDLWHDNIKVFKGELLPFDFEDTIIGYRLHDIAMAMLDLQEDSDPQKYPLLFKAFQEGYTSLLNWPEGNMTVLQMGRMLWQLNWVVRFWPAGFDEKLNEKLPLFREGLFTTNAPPGFPPGGSAGLPE